ncbi:MAG: hypothetical protein QOI01_1198 [Mycobacterium sp.]|nr:hypothetical protein [Mycobacterium sp.]
MKQVHEARIATDPNNCARYGDKVSDAAEPEEILDAEIVPADASAPPEQLPVIPADTGYTADGVPTFESVREKIETRYGTATGSAELASETAEGRQVEEQYEARQRAAHDRLEEIRAAMRDEPGPESGQA